MGERNTMSRDGKQFSYPVADGVTINAGNVVAMTAGAAQEGTVGTGLITVGVADNTVTADGTSSVAARVSVKVGTFLLDNDVGDPVTLADVGLDCFLTGPASVARTDGGGTRSRAGTIRDVAADGVWVTI